MSNTVYMHPEPASPFTKSARSTVILTPGVTREDLGTLSVGEKALAGIPTSTVESSSIYSPDRSNVINKMKNDIDTLKKDNESLRLENARFKRLLESSTNTTVTMSEPTQSLHDTITALTVQNKKCQSEINSLKDENRTLREMKRSSSVESDNKVNEVEKRNELLASAYRESTREQESLTNTVRRERAVVQREREAWIREKIVMETEADRLRRLLEDANDTIASMDTQLHNFRDIDIQLEIARQELELAKLRSLSNTDSKDVKLQEQQTRITALEAEKQNLLDENKQMKKEVMKAKELKTRVMEELAEQQNKDVAHVSEIASLQANNQALTKKRHEQNLRIQELEEDCATSRAVAESMEVDNDKLKSDVLALTAEKVELTNKLEAMQAKADGLQGEADRVADDYKAMLDERDREIFALKSQNSVLSWKIESYKSQLEASSNQDALNEMEQGYTAQITEILKNSEDRDRVWADKVEALNIELRTLRAEFNDKLEQKAKDELVRLTVTCDQRAEECSRLNEQLTAAKREIDVLRKENTALKSNAKI